MRAASLSGLLVLVAMLSACGAEEGRRRARGPSTPSVDEARADAAPPAGPQPRIVYDDALAAPLSRSMLLQKFETISIAPPTPPAEARPRRRGGRVDIELNGAPFVDTVHMLAEVGRFDVVIEAANATGVQASLHGVDPWDALVAICRAKGVDVRYERGIAIVGSTARETAQ
jgi:hypothetical protein